MSTVVLAVSLTIPFLVQAASVTELQEQIAQLETEVGGCNTEAERVEAEANQIRQDLNEAGDQVSAAVKQKGQQGYILLRQRAE